MNRLHLDFRLTSASDREAFITEYLAHPEFAQKPLTQKESETIANYLLWGTENGAIPDDGIIRRTKWTRASDESLDELIESPSFSDTELSLSSPARTLIRKEKFSRSSARKSAPADLLPIYEDLWREIDTTELLLNYYEIFTGKRKNAPRDELLARFSENEKESLSARATTLTQYQYLRKRHTLIELRKEQYTLRDSYSSTETRHTPVSYAPAPELVLNYAPLGLAEGTRAVLFPADGSIPTTYLAPPPIDPDAHQIDFRSTTDMRALLSEYATISSDESLIPLYRTLLYYVAFAHLSEIHTEIFRLKLAGRTNPEICAAINPLYGKTYNPNYISTIFHQKIIPEICDAATYHYELVSSLPNPKAWKKCSCCGKTLLLSSRNFTKKSKSSDGFQSRCKACEKAARIKE